MRGLRFASILAVALLGLGASAHAAVRDDTDLLQAKLDAGGTIFLPKLPNGQCYRTRGLWLSRRLCDAFSLETGRHGTTVRVAAALEPS